MIWYAISMIIYILSQASVFRYTFMKPLGTLFLVKSYGQKVCAEISQRETYWTI